MLFDDPIKHGVVASLNRPGGNVTGIYNFISSIEAKRFGLLHETVPTTGSIAVLLNPNYLGFDVQLKDLQEAARAVGQQIGVFNASSEADIHAAFRAMARDCRPQLYWLALIRFSMADGNNSLRSRPITASRRCMNCENMPWRGG